MAGQMLVCLLDVLSTPERKEARIEGIVQQKTPKRVRRQLDEKMVKLGVLFAKDNTPNGLFFGWF